VPSYDDLADRLLEILDGCYDDDKALVFPKRRYKQEHDEAVCAAVCRLTKMTRESWETLSPSGRIAWLDDAISVAWERRKPAPPSPAASSEPPPAESMATLAEQTDPESQAIALVLAADKDGRRVKMADVALAVGLKSRTSLYRWPRFKATLKALKANRRADIPKGSKTAEGELEAVGFDPDEE
jgi:hypothetical protein